MVAQSSAQSRPLSELNVAIIGLGLMGGSLALALRGKVKAIYGIDRNPETLAETALHLDRVSDQLEILAEADVVILAVPVQSIIGLLSKITPHLQKGALVFDLGSVKAPIVAAMRNLPPGVYAIGGHPMCGKESNGFAAAEPTLFSGCTFALCDCGRASPTELAIAETIVHAVGGVPFWIDPELHDRCVAMISHLPYLVSAALMAGAVNNPDRETLLKLASTGFRDVTRLAASDPTMMGDVLALNHESVRAAWRTIQAQVEVLLSAFERGEADFGQLHAVQDARQEWGTQFAQRTKSDAAD